MTMRALENHRQAVERLLEDENLTSEFTDEAADILLRWGAAQAEMALGQARSSYRTDAGTSMSRLRRVMKRINEQAGAAPPDLQTERVRSLLRCLDSRDETPSDP
jgi:hypothetical protein